MKKWIGVDLIVAVMVVAVWSAITLTLGIKTALLIAAASALVVSLGLAFYVGFRSSPSERSPMPALPTGSNVTLDLFDQDGQPPFTIHGIFRSLDDDHYIVEGTVGDLIGKPVLVPRPNVKTIIVHDKTSTTPSWMLPNDPDAPPPSP